MAIGIDFILKATTEGFTAGLAKANAALKDVKHELHSFGAPRSLAHAFGLIGIIEGFKLTIEHAQKTREEFEKLGRPVDAATLSVAKFGDAVGGIGHVFAEAGVAVLGFFTRVGEEAGQAINDLRDISRATVDIAEKTEKDAITAEKNLAKAREENFTKVKEALGQLKEAREATAEAGLSDENKIKVLLEEETEILKRFVAVGRDSLKGIEARIELVKKEKEIYEAQHRIEKAAKEASKKEGEEDLKWYKEHVKLEKELHDLKFAALTPEKQLAQLLAEEFALQVKIKKEKERGEGTLTDEVALQKNLNKQKEIEVKHHVTITEQMREQQLLREKADKQQAKQNMLLQDTIILMGKAYGTSRDPQSLADASDEELKALIAKNKREIALIASQKGTGLTALADAATGFLPQGIVEARLQTDNIRAQFQLDQRNRLQRDFALGGEANARSRFDGDPLAFDRLFNQFVKGQSVAEASAQTLTDIKTALTKTGILTVPTGGRG